MRRRYTILFFVVVGLFLTPGLGSAHSFTYTFLDETGDYGAYVTVQVSAKKDASSPFDDGDGTFYQYTYTYQVHNTGADTFDPIENIAWLRFTGAPYIEYGSNPGSGDVAVNWGDGGIEPLPDGWTLGDPIEYNEFQFDFDGGLLKNETSDEFWITSWFSNAELSYINQILEDNGMQAFPDAMLEDGGQTAFGDITSDLSVPSGNPLSNSVPEPGILLLLGSSLLAAACLHRFRKKK